MNLSVRYTKYGQPFWPTLITTNITTFGQHYYAKFILFISQ